MDWLVAMPNWVIAASVDAISLRYVRAADAAGASGNHFVEFGAFTVTDDALGIPPDEYVSLLSHSGSRGTGRGRRCATFTASAP